MTELEQVYGGKLVSLDKQNRNLLAEMRQVEERIDQQEQELTDKLNRLVRESHARLNQKLADFLEQDLRSIQDGIERTAHRLDLIRMRLDDMGHKTKLWLGVIEKVQSGHADLIKKDRDQFQQELQADRERFQEELRTVSETVTAMAQSLDTRLEEQATSISEGEARNRALIMEQLAKLKASDANDDTGTPKGSESISTGDISEATGQPAEQLATGSPVESTKAFRFTFALLTALHYCNWARDYSSQLRDSPGDFSSMITNLMTQNDKFEQGILSLRDYLEDSDNEVATVSKGVVLGIDMHIEVNKKVLEKLKKLRNLDPSALDNFEYGMAERAASQKKAWELLSMSSTFVVPILVEPAESLSPKGPIPFKITEQERLELLHYLNKLFGDDLKRYYAYKDARQRGLRGNPDDQTWITFAVDHIRDTLAVTTYEGALNLIQERER